MGFGSAPGQFERAFDIEDRVGDAHLRNADGHADHAMRVDGVESAHHKIGSSSKSKLQSSKFEMTRKAQRALKLLNCRSSDSDDFIHLIVRRVLFKWNVFVRERGGLCAPPNDETTSERGDGNAKANEK